jgi:hypothetical protein
LFLFSATILLLRQRRKRKLHTGQAEKFEKTEVADTSATLTKKEIFEIDGYQRNEIGGAQVFEKDYGAIIEMPTIHNEPVELEVTKSPISTMRPENSQGHNRPSLAS